MTSAPLSSVTAEAAPSGLYAPSQKIYPREVKGRFARYRKTLVFVLLGLFYGVAWLQWGDHQALLFDLPARKFHIFALTLWPQDFFYLALLLIIAALSLFFFTALAGRLWCGFACPQTVWTELFIWIEQWTEGSRSQRMKLDQGPWSWNKVLRKSSKQTLWVLLAAYTGFTFVGYFTPIRALGAEIGHLSLGPWASFWILLYSLATYGNAGFLREQVCKYMCPYARFQSAMFDKDTLIISYDETRGEPRGRATHVVRPKMIVYAALLLIALGTLLYSLMTRTPLILDIIRDRNALYREVHGDWIENAYTLRVINLDDRPHSYRLQVTGVPQLKLAAPTSSIEALPGSVNTISARLEAPATVASGVHAVTITLAAIDSPRISIREQARFIGPPQ